MACRPMFSEPAPLASTWTRISSPGTMDVWTKAGVLSPVFLRSKSGSRAMEPRRYPSAYPAATPASMAS